MSQTPDPQQPQPHAIIVTPPPRVTAPVPAAPPVRTDADTGEMWIQL